MTARRCQMSRSSQGFIRSNGTDDGKSAADCPGTRAGRAAQVEQIYSAWAPPRTVHEGPLTDLSTKQPASTHKIWHKDKFLWQRYKSSKLSNFLGIWFMEELPWRAHVNHLSIEVAQTFGCLYSIGSLIPQGLKKEIVQFALLFEKAVVAY